MDPNEADDDSDSSYGSLQSGQHGSESSDLSSESDSEEDFDDTDSHYTKSDSDESYISDIDLDVAYTNCMCSTHEAMHSGDESDEDGTGDEYLRQNTKPYIQSPTDSLDITGVVDFELNSPHRTWKDLNSMILINDGRGIVEWFSKNKILPKDMRETNWIFSPLYRAARCGSLSIFNFLLGEGFPHSTAVFSLVDAARNYNGDILERLVELGVDVNSADSSGFTALHAVAREETYRPAKTKFLLSRGADVDRQDEEGMAPLHYAVLMGCKGNVLELLRVGASVNLLTAKGRPVLHMAVYRGMNMVAILYKAGARPGLSQSYCEIEAAVKNQNLNVLRFLIKRNAPIKRLVSPESVLTSAVVSHRRCGEGNPTMIDVIVLYMTAGGKVDASVINSFTMDPCEFCGAKLEKLLSRYCNSRSLQEICCLKIRERLTSRSEDFSKAVQQLFIPDLLKDYVKLNNVANLIS